MAAGLDGHVDRDLDDLIQRVDLDGLVRMVDARGAARDWGGLMRVRDRCRSAAAESGRQLWPAATLAEYRLALWAPPEWAARVLDEESGRFTIGPLSEVVAVHHRWTELAPHLARGPVATFVAHERAIRGEPVDVTGLPPVLDIPARLQPWEPAYPISTYSDAGAEHPEPEPGATWEAVTATTGGVVVDDEGTELAVRQLVEAWTAASTGRAEVVCVEGGDHLDALGALGVRSARVAEVTASDAIARLAWAGASGGAHGRRRGMAIGRFSTWWLLGALGDLYDAWPPTNEQLTALLGDLRWYLWDAHEPPGGWRLQLLVHDPDEHVAWAINAADRA